MCQASCVEAPPRTKSFTFNINDDLSKYEIAGKVAVSVSVLAGLAILAIVSHCLFPVFGEKSLNEKLERIKEGSEQGEGRQNGNGREEVAMSTRIEGGGAGASGEESEVYENLRGNQHRRSLSGLSISLVGKVFQYHF